MADPLTPETIQKIRDVATELRLTHYDCQECGFKSHLEAAAMLDAYVALCVTVIDRKPLAHSTTVLHGEVKLRTSVGRAVHLKAGESFLTPTDDETPLRAHYSGPLSEMFWARVNATEDQTLYLAGCALQSHEGRVIQMIERIEIESVSPARPATPTE